ncbi:CHRD domain-containing protein [Natrarchaeobius chitinivorans]|uniref:CHRD domain-containing protein n=1 Tax=Natrarchaeobius chitinivorans TaxID=1679083 RepID=UPI001A9EFE86|nr:CHRD domain-containing protein [Natrarchaeobius chitinivorans]
MDDSRPSTEDRNDSDVRRRDLLALGGAAAVGAALGPATVSALNVQDADLEDEGLFLAAMTGGQQPEPVETDATGGAVFALTEGGTELEFALLVNAIEDVDQAHVHLGEVDEDGPVVAWLYPEPEADTPELLDGRFDGVLATDRITDEHVGGEAGGTIEGLVGEIRDGNAYVNVHTEDHPEGEIRGQLVTVEDAAEAILEGEPAVDIPEEGDPDDEDPDEVDPDDEEPDDDLDAEDVIEFLDCHTVRIVGDFPEAVLYLLELMGPDEYPELEQWTIGAMGSFPAGPVEGERTIDVREPEPAEEQVEGEFRLNLGDRVIISAVDVLDDGFGMGESIYERLNPNLDECIEQLFVDAGVEPPEEAFGEVPTADLDDEIDAEEPVDDAEEDDDSADEPEQDPDENGEDDDAPDEPGTDDDTDE